MLYFNTNLGATPQWKSTQSFGRNDLLVLRKVADFAHTRIFQLPQEEDAEAEA